MPTFRDLTPEFLRWHRARCQSGRTMPYIVRLLDRYFGDMEPEAMTVPVIEDFIAKRLEEGTARSTINRNRAGLSVFFEFCIARGHHPGPNPARRIKAFRESPGKTRFLTQKEAKRLVDAAAPHLKVFLMLALYTGARLSEILALTWGDCDFDAGLILFRKENTKSRKQRIVPLHPELRAVLEDLRRGSPEQRICHWNEQPLKSVKTAFETARDRAKLGKDVGVHTCRHSYASWAVQAGMPIYTLQKLLGHSTLALTERYSHLSPEFIAGSLKYISGPTR